MNLTLTPSKTRKAIVRIIAAGLVPFIQSSPAIGKSEITHGISQEYNLKLIDVRLSQCEPTDMSGIPFTYIDANGVKKAQYIPFDCFPLETDPLPPKLDKDGKQMIGPDGKPLFHDGWLLFLDEANSASRATQAAAYKLVLDRMVGAHKLHPKVAIVMAGNLMTDKAITYELSTAMQSRLIHIHMVVNKKDWLEWAAKNDIDTRVQAFIDFRPELLSNFDPEHSDLTFAAPRTWFFASKLVTGTPIDSDDLPLLAGTVGSGAAQEFITFTKVFDSLPSINDIMMDPMGTRIPQEMAARYAMASYLSSVFEDAYAENIIKYLERFSTEIQVLGLRMMMRKHEKILMKPTFRELFKKLGSFL